jgi:hypothetical protein
MQTQTINTLNSLQLELLKQFSYGLKKEEDLLAIKKMISLYLANKITNDMDRIWEENSFNDGTLDSWLKEDS